jgi:hypothetical protein
MIVYDIIQTVTPDAARNTSDPAGRWWMTSRDDQASAQRIADRYNQCCHVEGVRYTVEEIDESSPDRLHAAHCTCSEPACTARRSTR